MTTPAITPAAAPTPTYTPPAAGSRFVWHDLMTVDAPRAHAFYSALLGWSTQTLPMGEMGDYLMVSAGEHGVGGIVPLDASHGIPSHWIAYIDVADVDAACAQGEAIGGKTQVPPTDIPNIGRFAVVEDPAGAVFSPFHSTSEAPPVPGVPPLGTVGWNELLTTDPAAALSFYGALCGWTVHTRDVPGFGAYHMFMRGEQGMAGAVQMPPDATARPNWLPYFVVASVDASAAELTTLGGTVMMAPRPVEHWGRIAVAQDPTGAMFALLEFLPPPA